MTAYPPAATPSSEGALFTRAFVLLGVADLAYFTAAGVSIYALPLYVTGPLGSTKAGAGIAFGTFAISALALRPYSGRICDTLGRRPLLIAGALLAAVGLALTAYADSLSLVIALRLVLGVAEAAFFVASLAALVDLAPESRMGEAVSYNSLGLYLGLALGPPLGELLVENHGFKQAWFASASLAVVAALVVLTLGETRDEHAEVGHQKLIHRKALPVALAFFSSLVAVGGFLAFAALHAEDVGLSSSSLPLIVYGLVVVVFRVAFAKFPDRVPPLQLGAAALATIAAGLVVTALWLSPLGMVAGTALMAVGVTFSTPAYFSAIFATAGPNERGAASGTASLFIDLGLGGGPIALGFVAQLSGIPTALMVGAGFAALGAVWSLRMEQVNPIPVK